MRPRIGLGKCSHIQSIIPNSDLASTRSPQKVIRRGCPFFSGCSFIILRRYRIVWGHSTAQLRADWNLLTTFSCRSTCVVEEHRNGSSPNSQGNPGLRPGIMNSHWAELTCNIWNEGVGTTIISHPCRSIHSKFPKR